MRSAFRDLGNRHGSSLQLVCLGDSIHVFVCTPPGCLKRGKSTEKIPQQQQQQQQHSHDTRLVDSPRNRSCLSIHNTGLVLVHCNKLNQACKLICLVHVCLSVCLSVCLLVVRAKRTIFRESRNEQSSARDTKQTKERKKERKIASS